MLQCLVTVFFWGGLFLAFANWLSVPPIGSLRGECLRKTCPMECGNLGHRGGCSLRVFYCKMHASCSVVKCYLPDQTRNWIGPESWTLEAGLCGSSLNYGGRRSHGKSDGKGDSPFHTIHWWHLDGVLLLYYIRIFVIQFFKRLFKFGQFVYLLICRYDFGTKSTKYESSYAILCTYFSL